MLVFSAFCPHAPILIPSVGKENIDQLAKTAKAYKQLEQEFLKSQPESVVVISPHGNVYKDAISIDVCDQYIGDFEEFGEFSTRMEFRSDYLLIDRLQRMMREIRQPLTLDTCEKLDHGTTVPLHLLTEQLPSVHLAPITASEASAKNHFEFGLILKEIIFDSNKRIALIASGDLSHALSTEAPAGFAEEGKMFDEKIQELLASNNYSAIINLDSKLHEKAAECGLNPLSTLLGALKGVQYDPKILSYEAPFGVGYMVCQFELK